MGNNRKRGTDESVPQKLLSLETRVELICYLLLDSVLLFCSRAHNFLPRNFSSNFINELIQG